MVKHQLDRLTETEVRQILSRAVDLERKGMTVTELRAVAAEAGINDAALEVAMADVLRARHARPNDAPSSNGSLQWLKNFGRKVAVGASGLAVGALTWLLAPPAPHNYGSNALNLVGVVLMIAGSLKLVFDNRPTRALQRFEAEVLVLWLSFMGGWSLARGAIWEDMVGVAGMFWLGAAVIGGLIVYLRRSPPAGDRGE